MWRIQIYKLARAFCFMAEEKKETKGYRPALKQGQTRVEGDAKPENKARPITSIDEKAIQATISSLEAVLKPVMTREQLLERLFYPETNHHGSFMIRKVGPDPKSAFYYSRLGHGDYERIDYDKYVGSGEANQPVRSGSDSRHTPAEQKPKA
jgi:hypothetical protein